MKTNFKQILPSLLNTLLVLIIFEVISTTFLPLLGLSSYRLPFNILIILFMGFKLDTPYLAVMIFLVQYFHSFFSIEGWAMGTIAGIFVCTTISYLRDLIHFSTAVVTMFVTQMFQLLWFLIVASFIYIQLGEMDYVLNKLWRFIPESIIISLFAPLFFVLMERIWNIGGGGLLVGEE